MEEPRARQLEHLGLRCGRPARARRPGRRPRDREEVLTSVYAAVAGCLRDSGLEVSEDQQNGRVVTEFEGSAGTWLLVGEAHEDLELAAVSAVLRGLVAPERREPVALLLTLINAQLLLGGFTLDLDDGEVRFRAALDFAGTEPNPRLVRPLAAMCVIAPERWLEAIEAVATGEDPQSAFAVAAAAGT